MTHKFGKQTTLPGSKTMTNEEWAKVVMPPPQKTSSINYGGQSGVPVSGLNTAPALAL